MTAADVATAEKAEHSHARSTRGAHAGRAVFDDQTSVWRKTELARCMQVGIGRGLGTAHTFRTVDMLADQRRKARVFDTAVQAVDSAV